VDKLQELCVPLSGSLELTHRCNLKCRHCYQYPARTGEMSTSEWLGIIDQLEESGCLFLALTGGEPTLRKDIFDIIEAAYARNFALTLQTNGTLLSKEDIRRLGELKTLRVDISVYGSKPDTHDFMTREPGSFTTIRRNLELLKENEVPIILKVVVCDFNLPEVEEISNLAEELETTAIFTALIFPRNDGDRAPTAMRLNEEQLESFMRFEMDYLPRYLSEISGFKVRDVAEYIQKCAIGPQDPEGGKKRYCGAGRTVFALNPYGDLYPCVAFPLSVANVREVPLLDAWRDAPILEELRAAEMELPEECEACPLLDKCGICRALSFQEEGEAVAVSPEKCRMTHTLMRLIDDL
jgi:AdoMet-dependent heme synthase